MITQLTIQYSLIRIFLNQMSSRKIQTKYNDPLATEDE